MVVISPGPTFSSSTSDSGHNTTAVPSPFPSASGRTGTVFGVPNVWEVDFESKPLPFYSNSAACGTGIVFGTPKEPNLATGSDGCGVSYDCNKPFQGSITGAFGVSANLGFGIQSLPSSPSGPNSSGHGTSTSGFGVLNGPPFKYVTAGPDCCRSMDIRSRPSALSGRMSNDLSASPFKFNSVLATESQRVMAPKGSKASPYSATKISGSWCGKILSISGMEIYKDKSHEELRLEDYGLRYKGAHGRGGFKLSDFPSNVLRFPSSLEQSSSNPPMELFKFNPFAPKKQDFVTSSVTTSKTFPFWPFKPNPFPLKSQDSITSNDKIAKPCPLEPFKCNPFVPRQQDLVTLNATNSTISSSATVPSGPFMPTQPTSVSLSIPWPFTRHESQPGPNKNPIQPSKDDLTMAKEVGCQNINGQQKYSLTVPPFSMLSAFDQPKTTSAEHGISSLPASNSRLTKENKTNRTASLLRIRHVSLRKNSLPASRFIRHSSEAKVPFFCDEVDRPGLVGPLLPRANPRAWIKNSLSFHEPSGSKTCEEKDTPISYSSKTHPQDPSPSITGKAEADISSLMPKLPRAIID